LNTKERTILADAIRVVNSLDGWDLVRKGDLSEITVSMNLALHDEDSLCSTMSIISYMADNWDSWVEKRSLRQDIDEKNKRSIESWIRSHQYTENTNNFILISYLENLLRYIEDWSVIDRMGSGAEDLIYSIECVIAKLDDVDKADVYKKVVAIDLPSDYELTRALMEKHRQFIKDSEEEYEEQLNTLRAAILERDLNRLQLAMRSPKTMKRLQTSPEYLVAMGIEEELVIKTDGNL
jgi:hypothetical protein